MVRIHKQSVHVNRRTDCPRIPTIQNTIQRLRKEIRTKAQIQDPDFVCVCISKK
ncbi:hypothetical protein RHMOL_Rhmol08G0148300 [Rhododendron molle]|uniref:Uncharacterized protein n=1 Tax=Rhododendron molle TaxID=49168 RepID=A0ACC0MNR1_RHOML|nr:hypothetical protein RHMOL_Rhmol08G0148300 [Rhododendron molle]